MSSVPFPISTQSKWLLKANFPEKWKIPLTWVVSTFVPHFKTSLYLFIFPRGRSAPYFCQHVSRALASSSTGPLFNHLLSLASNFLSWQLPLSLEIYSGFSPAQKHSLSPATPTSFALKQRSFTATLLKDQLILTASSSSAFTHENPCSLACAHIIQGNYMLRGHWCSTKHQIHSVFSVIILLNLSIVPDPVISLFSQNAHFPWLPHHPIILIFSSLSIHSL